MVRTTSRRTDRPELSLRGILAVRSRPLIRLARIPSRVWGSNPPFPSTCDAPAGYRESDMAGITCNSWKEVFSRLASVTGLTDQTSQR